MSQSQPAPIVLYDLSGGPAENPHKLTAPSPWKVRYALNFKKLNYRTEWVDLPDVPSVRQGLGVETKDRYPDGTPYYTLPILKDDSEGKKALLGETFDIAVYLDKAYPDGPSLFPGGTVGLMAAFNDYVEALFAPFVFLNFDDFPFNSATEESTKAKLAARMGKTRWEDVLLTADARKEMLRKFESEMGKLARHYETKGTSGPFLLGGETPTFADFIVGARLMALQCAIKEWDEVQMWHGGLWGRLHKALAPWREVK
ncbi:hypothetical protein F5Y17DRAFT_448984 [Xylariaceae sp. FL0594]|nr:hypothetical protein F5Y17DRAFT_448984 [Xylariaceae sp. FL0594]